MIFGICLSDRVYVAADTRVTFTKDDKVTEYKDDVLKITSVGLNCVVAIAGNVTFAKYYLKNLLDKANEKSVAEIRDNVEEWSREIAADFFNDNPYTSISLIFGGMDPNEKHRIDGKKLTSLVKDFQKVRQVPMVMKPNLFAAISAKPNEPNPYPELPNNKPVLFSVILGPPNKGITLEDAFWGEYLAYGPGGINKETISQEIFGRLEFEAGCGDYIKDTVNTAALISIEAENRNLPNVGGAIVTNAVDDAVKVVTSKISRVNTTTGVEDVISEIKLENNRFYSKLEGDWVELLPILDYPQGKISLNI